MTRGLHHVPPFARPREPHHAIHCVVAFANCLARPLYHPQVHARTFTFTNVGRQARPAPSVVRPPAMLWAKQRSCRIRLGAAEGIRASGTFRNTIFCQTSRVHTTACLQRGIECFKETFCSRSCGSHERRGKQYIAPSKCEEPLEKTASLRGMELASAAANSIKKAAQTILVSH